MQSSETWESVVVPTHPFPPGRVSSLSGVSLTSVSFAKTKTVTCLFSYFSPFFLQGIILDTPLHIFFLNNRPLFAGFCKFTDKLRVTHRDPFHPLRPSTTTPHPGFP